MQLVYLQAKWAGPTEIPIEIKYARGDTTSIKFRVYHDWRKVFEYGHTDQPKHLLTGRLLSAKAEEICKRVNEVILEVS